MDKVNLMYDTSRPNRNGTVVNPDVMKKAIEEAFERYPEGIPIVLRDDAASSMQDFCIVLPEHVVGHVFDCDVDSGSATIDLVGSHKELIKEVLPDLSLYYRAVADNVEADGTVTGMHLVSYGLSFVKQEQEDNNEIKRTDSTVKEC